MAAGGDGLTPRQRRFVEEYLIDLNAAAAARRAGYSVKAAKEVGCENLTKPNVRAAIDLALAQRADRTGLSQDYVIRGLMREAEYDGDGASHAARVQALRLLGDHLRMFGDAPAGGATVHVRMIEVKKTYGAGAAGAGDGHA